MKPVSRRRLAWLLALAMYGVFLWRTPYSLKSFPLYILDWLLPAVGLGVWLAASWWRRASWPATALDLPLLAWMATALVSTATSVDLRASLHAIWQLVIWLLLLWLMVSAMRRGWGRALWQSTYLTGGVVCLLAAVEVLSWYFGLPLLSTFQQGWFDIGGFLDPIPPTVYRIALTLGHPTVLSAFLALLVPPAISFLFSSRVRDVRLGMVLWLAGAVVILGFTDSRGSILALGVSLPLLFVGASQSPQIRSRWSTLSRGRQRALVTLILVLGLASAMAAGYFVLSRMGAHAAGDAVRTGLWRSALVLLKEHPVTGVGKGAFGYAVRAVRDPLLATDQVATAHNVCLNAGAEMGIMGLLAGAWLFLTLTVVWWRRWRGSRPGSSTWWRVLGAGTALAGLAAQMMVENFVEPAVLLPAVFFIAYIAWSGPREQKSENRGRRWPWITALAFLVAGSIGQTWETWAYAQYRESVTALRQGNQEQADAAAERALSQDPWFPLYSCHLGYLRGLEAARGHGAALPMALKHYEDCVNRFAVPSWLDQLNLAIVQMEAGQEQSARDSVREATANTPLEWLPWLTRGLWAERSGDDEEATASYRRVLALAPQLAGSPFWQESERADLWSEIVPTLQESVGSNARRWHLLLAAGFYDQAAVELESWLEKHPTDAMAMARLGESLVALGRPSEGLVWLDQSLASMPARAESYLSRGEAKVALGFYEQAEHDLRIALFLNPDAQVHLALARLARAQGADDLALEEYRRAQRVFTVLQKYPQVLYHRMGWFVPLPQVTRIGYKHDAEVALEWGTLLERRGDTEAAAEAYEAALNLDPFLAKVRQRLERLGQ